MKHGYSQLVPPQPPRRAAEGLQLIRFLLSGIDDYFQINVNLKTAIAHLANLLNSARRRCTHSLTLQRSKWRSAKLVILVAVL